MILYHHLKTQMELRHMKNKHNPTMSHNACYAILPSSKVVFLRSFEFRTDTSLYYIRLYFDKATGKYFYTFRDSVSFFRLYSCAFHCERNCLLAIRDLVSHYIGLKLSVSIIPLCRKECD